MSTASRRGAWIARCGSLATGASIAVGAVAADALPGAEPGVGPEQVAFLVAGAAVCGLCLLPVRWNQRALLLVLATGMACLVVEAALRLLTPWGETTVFELHPRYLHRYVPWSSKMFRRLRINGAQSIVVTINEHGFRGEPLAQPKTGLRVVVYGDSCVAAEFSSLEDTLVARLGARLSEALGRPVEAVNAGVPMYGPDQSLLRMEDELPWLDADLVVFGLFADNDLGDLLRNKIFRLGRDGELADNPHTISDELRATFLGARRVSALGRLVAGEATFEVHLPDPHSSEAIALEEARMLFWLDQCAVQYVQTVLEGSPYVMSPMADHYDADVSLEPGSDAAQYKIRLLDRVLARMGRLTAQVGVPLVTLVIPSPLDVCDDLRLGRVDRARFPNYDASRLTRVCAELARRNALRHVDLYGPFTEHGADALHFKYGNEHWNEAGQDLAARLLTELIVAEGLLPAK